MFQRSPHILLIDDNKHGSIARRAILEEKGYVVDVAHDGVEGLEKFEAQPFDLVVTDYRMPRMGGRQVVRQIRERNPAVPVVILSGYVAKLGLTSEAIGADAVLTKGPSEHQDLVRTVARLVRRRPGRVHATAVAGCRTSA